MNFKLIKNAASADEFIKENKKSFNSKSAAESVRDMICSYLEVSEGAELAAAIASGSLVFRIFDGEYVFTCPITLSESASVTDACEEIRRYAIREEIPVSIIDAGLYELPYVEEAFRFCESFEMDEDGEVFMVHPITEAGRVEELPTLLGERSALTAIFEDDIPDFARLCRNENTNRLFGYNYKEDYEDAPDEHFYNVMRSEEAEGLALSFAIRYEGHFAGEASLFGFDYLGGARVAVRLLPEFYGKGLGSEALSLIIDFARDIDIKTLETAVKRENLPSIKMTGKFMSYIRDEGDTAIFKINF